MKVQVHRRLRRCEKGMNRNDKWKTADYCAAGAA